MRTTAQLAVYVPSLGMVRHAQAHTFVLFRAGNDRVRVQEREGLAELAFCITLELLATNGERFKQARHNHGRASLKRCRMRAAAVRLIEAGLPGERLCLSGS